MDGTNQRIAMRVSWITIFCHILMAALKLAAGLAGHSAALVSDALHSAADMMSTAIVMAGVRMAGKASDKKHPYGHERFECVAAIVLSAVLAATGLGVGYGSLRAVLAGGGAEPAVPGVVAMAAALFSIAVQEGLYWYARRAALRIGSGALMADAWHHRSDALSSVGSLVGVWGARRGFPFLDGLAGLVICLFIIRVAFRIFAEAIEKMTDSACEDPTEEKIRALVLAQEGVLGIDALKTRKFGDKICADVEIAVDSAASVGRGHEIAHRVHDAVENGLQRVKHCMVHVNPHAREGGGAGGAGG